MKRILFLISYLDKGGTERALSNITTHFPQEWDIDILVNDNRVIDYPFRGRILTLGITERPQTSSIFFQLKVLLKRVKRLRKLKKQGNYQACVSFLDSANVANILSGKRYCRVIVSVRSSLMQSAQLPQYKYIVNPLARLLYNSADKVVAVSKGVEFELKELFHIKSSKLSVIENGYDLHDIQRLAKEELTDKEKELFEKNVVIATIGRLSAPKGQWHLVRAFAEVVKRVPNAFLMIIGSGELEKYLKELCQKCKVGDQVCFTGYVSNPYKYLNASDIFVLPSLYEGFPNALAEAVCLELPCIATDFRTGAREILAPDMNGVGKQIESVIEAEYGILTPICSGTQYSDLNRPLESSERYLAEAMIKLLKDEEKRKEYSQRSKKRRETLSIDMAIDKWIKVVQAQAF